MNSPTPTPEEPARVTPASPSKTMFDSLDLNKIKNTLQETQSIVGLVFASVLSAAATLQVPPLWAKYLAATITGLLLTIAALVTFKRSSASKTTPSAGSQSQEGAAFRGLKRFHTGETLPGKSRRVLAGALLNKVKSANFRICVVTGDSGAGKSSLIDCALTEPMRAAGFAVARVDRYSIYERSTMRLSRRSAGKAAEQIWQLVIQGVQRESKDEDVGTLLILDQFEEALLQLTDSDSRRSMGDAIATALASDWKIVIGIRKEYLSDLQDVARALNLRITLAEDIFNVRNFDATEAAAVIEECALRDGIACSKVLCDEIAEDLATNGEVRPPDLQIVCDSLRRQMTIDRYRERGRATGLRAAFLTETMALAGPPELTRSILRQLCDIPNNKKSRDPLTLNELVERVAAGAGKAATSEAVQAILTNLADAYILVRLGTAELPRWSLIHDYFVEPIKLATEDAETRRESSMAELDFYLAKMVVNKKTVIPLARLRDIKRGAPKHVLEAADTRKLLFRSIVIGYGKPIGLNVLVGALAIVSVLMLGTEWHVWRSMGNASIVGGDTNPSEAGLSAWGMASDSGSRIIVASEGDYNHPENRAVSVWDAESGQEIGEYSGSESSIVSNYLTSLWSPAPSARFYLWSYKPGNGELKRMAGGKTADWSHIIPVAARPGPGFSISLLQPPDPSGGVVFEDFQCQESSTSCMGIFFPATDSYREITRQSIAPSGSPATGSGSHAPVQDSMFFTAGSKGWLARSPDGHARITLWRADMQNLLCDFSTEGSVVLIGVLELNGMVYAALYSPSQQQLHTISASVESIKYAGACPDKVADWPKTLTLQPGLVQMLLTPNHFLLRQDEPTKTVIWPIDPVAGKFSDPITAQNVAPRVDGAFVWTLEGGSDAGIWLPNRDAFFKVAGLGLASTDRVIINEQGDHLLRTTKEGRGELWRITTSSRTADLVLQFKGSGFTSFNFSHNQKAVIGRRRGGQLFGWSLDGQKLGPLGDLGSNMIWSSYDPKCDRMLIWTAEGEILDWRRGIAAPLLGFFPENRCGALTKGNVRTAKSSPNWRNLTLFGRITH
ncbi:MAG: ATP-binding protein [Proteobacteria bacterium]|nr:ATP-binding protein [Pseudomonadota bacterium]